LYQKEDACIVLRIIELWRQMRNEQNDTKSIWPILLSDMLFVCLNICLYAFSIDFFYTKMDTEGGTPYYDHSRTHLYEPFIQNLNKKTDAHITNNFLHRPHNYWYCSYSTQVPYFQASGVENATVHVRIDPNLLCCVCSTVYTTDAV
jgi:hypothetical protein